MRAGGIIAYPTEAVFGLGCDPDCEDAVEHLLTLKQRPQHKGLILIAADAAALEPYLARVPHSWRRRALASWPGPNTWIWPAAADTPRWLRGKHAGIAVRVTAHPLSAALCRAAGGVLVSTSANLAGHPPARSEIAVRRAFGSGVERIVHGALGGQSRPSTIRDLTTGRVLRA